MHKGSNGRIAVFGGSVEYTGAPYFAAMAALRMGADLAYIFCMPEAATAIKSYAPELVVYPYLNPEDSVEQVMARVVPVLSKMHAVVIGPGLSTNPRMLDFAINVVRKCLELDCPTILDADALRIMALVKLKLTKNVFLTPNAFEFGRLLESQEIDPADVVKAASILSDRFDCCMLVKGPIDICVYKDVIQRNDISVSPRRIGGQGDILCGLLATLLAWNQQNISINGVSNLSDFDSLLVACGLEASRALRMAAGLAYQKHGDSLITSEILLEIGAAKIKLRK